MESIVLISSLDSVLYHFLSIDLYQDIDFFVFYSSPLPEDELLLGETGVDLELGSRDSTTDVHTVTGDKKTRGS